VQLSSWCKPRDHMVTQPTMKIEIWSWKVKIGLIEVWHNENLLQGINTIEMSRMMPRSQLIFDKSDLIRSRTEECKNYSHMLKLKNSDVIFIHDLVFRILELESTFIPSPLLNTWHDTVQPCDTTQPRSDLDFSLKFSTFQFYIMEHSSKSNRWIELKLYPKIP